MKASDFTTTSSQREAASQTLLQTEQTDAVNSGLVGKADKSGSALKGSLYSTGKKAATGGAASAALSSVTKGRRGASSAEPVSGSPVSDGAAHGDAAGTVRPSSKGGRRKERPAQPGSGGGGGDGRVLTGTSSGGSRRGGRSSASGSASGSSGSATRTASGAAAKGGRFGESLKAGAKRAGKGAVLGTATRKTLEGTELEGADDLYYKGKGAYRLARGVKRRLSGRDAMQADKPLGQLSEKKSAKKAADTLKGQRNAQASSYFKRTVYKTAEKAKAATGAAKGIAAVTGHGGGGGILAAASPASVFLPLILILLFFMLIIGGMGADETQKKTVGSLTGVQAEIATSLKGLGFTNEATAAVLGNMKAEKGNFDPTYDGDDGKGNQSLGIMQFSGKNRTDFLRWCKDTGRTPYTVPAQIEWVFGRGSAVAGWGHAFDDPYFYNMEPGYEGRFSTDYYRDPQQFKTSTDVDLATYSFMACYERCGNNGNSHLDTRLENARGYLAQLVNSGGGGSTDIVAVAASQIGQVGGQPYWSWWGYSSRVDWCAIFVSWCANQCGYIESGIIPKYQNCAAGAQWFRDAGQFQPRGYVPSPGDIIFFASNGDIYHTGIVESCDGATVYTIEGNTSNSVARRSYGMNSAVIYGYGIPKY